MTLQRSGAASSAPSRSAAPGRLLLLCTAMGIGGGAEEQVIRLAYAFKARGWEVLIVSMVPPSPMPADFATHQIPLEHLGMSRATPDPRGLFRLAKIIREFRPDVVHTHMVHSNLIARAARPMAPFPVLVCTLHNLTMAGEERDHTGIFELAHRVTDRLADRTTTIAHAAADYYIRRRAVPAEKMMVIPNGIDCGHFAHNPDARRRLREEMGIDDQFVWLAAGRLELQKAYPTMLRAFTQLDQSRNTLLICGRGKLREQLEAMATEMGLGEKVRFLGLRRDIPDVMSAADAFAMSSDMEGLPLVLLQACAAGLPIVATNVAGNPEVVIDGVNGYLTPPGDPQIFGNAMARLLALTASDRTAMGLAGLKRISAQFEIEPVVDRWEQLFRELLGTSGGRRRRIAAVAPVGGDEKLVAWAP